MIVISLWNKFKQFTKEVIPASPLEFKDFDSNSDSRQDSFLFFHMGGKCSYQSLWKVVADLLTLSHGQASVEKGFSVNCKLEGTIIYRSEACARPCKICKFVIGIKLRSSIIVRLWHA